MNVSRVLMTADTVGGVWTYAIELIRALEPHGVEVALATMGAPLRPDQRAGVEALPNATALFESSFRLEWMDHPWEDIRASGEWLLDIEARIRPDIVHLNAFAHGSLPWRAPVVVVGHSCVLSWWEAVRGEPAPPAWERYREAVAAGLAGAVAVIAPSRAMLSALEKFYGVHRGAVIPNARSAPAAVRTADEPAVLSAGRLWDEGKNIRALAAIAPRLPWPVCVAGDCAHPDGGIPDLGGLRLLGRLAPCDLAGWYARAPIYASPARYEPFGLTVLEAARAGCALVLGDIPSLRENWDGVAAFVPPSDAGALEAAILGLIDNPQRRAEMQGRARGRAAAFSSEKMARAYMSVYAAAFAKGSACAS